MIHYLKGNTMNGEILELLSRTPLFEGANLEILGIVLSEGTCEKQYMPEDTISPNESGKKNLAVMLKGKAQVRSSDTDRRVLLRTLEKGDIFGVAELFGGSDGTVSRIVALKNSSVLFIPEAKMGILLEKDKKVMYNYMNFLCRRIRFLNKRIACFTAGSAERRLAFYLESLATESGSSTTESIKVTPEVSMGALAEMLDIGRASLYRAIDTLSDDGFIEKSGKSFILRDREKMLKSYTK